MTGFCWKKPFVELEASILRWAQVLTGLNIFIEGVKETSHGYLLMKNKLTPSTTRFVLLIVMMPGASACDISFGLMEL
jgi:hypothetical protein